MSMEMSDLSVQITLTIGEMRKLVEYINLADEVLTQGGEQAEPVVEEVTGLYFRLMQSIQEDGYLGDFEPE